MGRWKIHFDTVDPRKVGETWSVGIRESDLDRLRRTNHECYLARIRCVDEVLNAPELVIEGWDRPDRDDCYVYVGRPSRDYRSLSIDVPAPRGQVFLVFVLPDGTIDSWGWRPVDALDPARPEDMKGKQAWPKS